MNLKQIGLSMDGGFIYQTSPNKYIKITISPTDNIESILSNNIDNINKIDKIDVEAPAKYSIIKYNIPKPWNCRTFVETYDFYKKEIFPKIKPVSISTIVFNKIIYDDNDIILGNDLKYKTGYPYYVLFVKNPMIFSIRELNGNHLNLLKKINKIALEYITKCENVDPDQIRLYIHYYPSVWLLHVHINLLTDKFESTSIDYGYKLYDIIQNIIIYHNFYQIVELQIIDRFNPFS
jgi:m7GpppX diphosphatase